MTFNDLTIGAVVSYTDSANPTKEAVVLGKESTKFGDFVHILWKDDNKKDMKTSHTKIGENFYFGWQLVQA